MSFSNDPAIDVNQLPISIEFPNDERFNPTLTNWAKRVANSVNSKEGGLYSLQEFFNFKQYFIPNNPNSFRNDYRKTFDLVSLNAGPIAGGASVVFPHGIVGILYGTLIYAGCTTNDQEFFSVMGHDTIYLDDANIYFTNPLATTPLIAVIAVAEYLKN